MNLIATLLTIQNQLRVFHWQTRSYAAHKALGDAYEALDGLIDEFVETYQGKNGLIMAKDAFSVRLENIPDAPAKALEAYCEWLSTTLAESLDPKKDTDLLNIRDEMLGVLNKTRYLLSLK